MNSETILAEQRDVIVHSVSQRNRELQLSNEQLKALSLVDSLTGLGNRRAMTCELERTHKQSIRYNRPYSVALFDVDHFSRYNDCYGERDGDAVLQRTSEYLRQSTRSCDRIYRFGGEEFLMILPETSLHGTLILADRVLAGLAGLKIPHEKSSLGVVTLSCGVASQVEVDGYATWEELMDLADRGLYASKINGRNRTTIIPPEDAVDDSVPRMHGTNS